MNYNIESYEFGDLDLETAVNRLPKRRRKIVVLHCMGFTQTEIGRHLKLTRGMICKELKAIRLILRGALLDGSRRV